MKQKLKVALLLTISSVIVPKAANAYGGDYKTVHVNMGGSVATYETGGNTVSEFLKESGITVEKHDYMNKDSNEVLTDGEIIQIEKSTDVTIVFDGTPRLIKTTYKTVGDLLNNEKNSFGTDYALDSGSLDDIIESGMTITVHTKSENFYSETEEIPFETEFVYTDELDEGVELMAQEGISGKKEITYKQTVIANNDPETKKINENISKEPVNAIVHVGTGKVVRTAYGDFRYKDVMLMNATAYTRYDPGCTDYTALGMYATYGVVAVDPRVIPLGTRLYVEGYGYAIAGDTGGAIKGNKIDLCYDSRDTAISFGRQMKTVYILKD